jgi:hypothetical protein
VINIVVCMWSHAICCDSMHIFKMWSVIPVCSYTCNTSITFCSTHQLRININLVTVRSKCRTTTPWPKSTSELYRTSDCRLWAKLVPTSVDRGCRVVSWTDPYGRNLDFLDRSCYYFFQVVPQLYSRGWVDPVSDPLPLRKYGSAGNLTRDLWICSQELWPQRRSANIEAVTKMLSVVRNMKSTHIAPEDNMSRISWTHHWHGQCLFDRFYCILLCHVEQGPFSCILFYNTVRREGVFGSQPLAPSPLIVTSLMYTAMAFNADCLCAVCTKCINWAYDENCISVIHLWLPLIRMFYPYNCWIDFDEIWS